MLYIPNHVAISSQYLYLAPPCTARLGVLTYWRYLSGRDLLFHYSMCLASAGSSIGGRRLRYLGNSGPHTGDHSELLSHAHAIFCSPFSCQTTEQASPCDTTTKYMYYRPLTPSLSFESLQLFHGNTRDALYGYCCCCGRARPGNIKTSRFAVQLRFDVSQLRVRALWRT